MPFLKGPVTFQRFRVAGTKPRLFDDTHLDRLRGLAAGRQKRATADGVECGWAAGSHALDTDFRLEKNVYPDHLVFDFWTQRDRLPPDRMKVYYETELKALARDNPSGFPSSRQKREAKAIARTRLEQEAKDGRYRKWKCVPCAWDLGTNTVFFGAAGGAAVPRFDSLWEQTFCADLTQEPLGGELEAVTAASLACALDPKCADLTLSPFVPGVAPADGPAWCPVDGVPQWLGNEFLLWLWYYADVESDTVRTPDGTETTFMFSGGVKVQDPRGVSGDCTANSESAVRLPEARAAIRAGKLPRKAALTVVRAGEQFRFVLQAETLAVTGARLPTVDSAEVPLLRERDAARLQYVRDLAEVIDQLFGCFVARRLAAGWDKEVKDIGAWLKGGRVRA